MNRLPAAFLSAVLLLAVLAGCNYIPKMAWDDAVGIAAHMPPSFSRRVIAAGGDKIDVFERVRQPGQVAAVYIGEARDNDTALALAAQDVTSNVFYLARPSKSLGDSAVAALSRALDDIRATHNVYGFNLTGYGTGAAAAALLAASRSDVLSLRTVAGRLEPARGVAARLIALPQNHFIAAGERGTDGYITDAARPDCLSATVVEGLGPEKTWVAVWPGLLEQPLGGQCP